MAEALVFLVLKKIGASLADTATSRITSKLVEDISVLTEVDNRMKNIGSEFVVMQAYISDADVCKANNKTFEAWLEQLRKVAYEVEDAIDEYVYLTGKQQTSRKMSFLSKTFPYSRNNVALRNIDKVPNAVANLVNLHYLDVSYTKVKNIPRSLGKLLNLQTLDLRQTSVEMLPKDITMIQKLRHLFLVRHNDWEFRTFNCFSGVSVPDDICSLRNLQTLYGVESSRVLVRKIGSLTKIRTLYILKVQRSYCEALWASLTKIPRLHTLGLFASRTDEILNLENLKPLPNLQKLKLRGRLEEGVVPSIFSSFGNLRELVMGWSGLREDPIAALSIMSNLVTLNLCMVYDGQGLAFLTGWFPKLKYLCLADMLQLAWINVEDGAMKSLQTLELTGLQNLKMVPEGVKYLKSIKDMYLRDMPTAFIERLEGTDREIVVHIPNIVY